LGSDIVNTDNNVQGNKDAPLNGLRIIEFAGLGPGPFAAMMLADMGAEIIRIDRPNDGSQDQAYLSNDYLGRGRQSLVLDLKKPDATRTALRLIKSADGLIEGFRPGVMERLGLGPEVCLSANPKLVYGRMTGWGQTGPLAHSAGHDLNYIALTGALWSSGTSDQLPQFAMNLLGDFGGGGMLLAFGMVSGLLKANRTGCGDVIDASVYDGTTSLMAFIHGLRAKGHWQDERCANELDGAAPWYAVYPCSDGRWISIAALEPKFWECLLNKLGLRPEDFGDRQDRATWPATRARLATLFAAQPREHWEALLSGTDACFAPVLSPAEATEHAQAKARGAYQNNTSEPAPAPRFTHSRTPPPVSSPVSGADSVNVLRSSGFSDTEIDALIADGCITQYS